MRRRRWGAGVRRAARSIRIIRTKALTATDQRALIAESATTLADDKKAM